MFPTVTSGLAAIISAGKRKSPAFQGTAKKSRYYFKFCWQYGVKTWGTWMTFLIFFVDMDMWLCSYNTLENKMKKGIDGRIPADISSL